MGALAPIMCRVLVRIIVVMGLRHSVRWITGVFLLPYLLQHLCRPVLVPILHVRDQVFVMLFQPRVEAILLHVSQFTLGQNGPRGTAPA